MRMSIYEDDSLVSGKVMFLTSVLLVLAVAFVVRPFVEASAGSKDGARAGAAQEAVFFYEAGDRDANLISL